MTHVPVLYVYAFCILTKCSDSVYVWVFCIGWT